MIWVIGDTHFGHKKISFYNKRGGDWEERYLYNISSTPFRRGDMLIHLGDFAFSKPEKWYAFFKAIAPAKAILVRGNHDFRYTQATHLRYGWDSVVDELVLNIYSQKILFSHVPKDMPAEVDINVHGHFHNKRPDRWNEELLVRVTPYHRIYIPEYWDGKPLPLEDVLRDTEKTSTNRILKSYYRYLKLKKKQEKELQEMKEVRWTF